MQRVWLLCLKATGTKSSLDLGFLAAGSLVSTVMCWTLISKRELLLSGFVYDVLY